MSGDSTDRDALFLLARILFGGVLAFMGIDNLRSLEEPTGYAESKDVPAAEKAVPLSSGMLVAGGVGIVLWRLPALAAASVASFLIGVTPMIHDFWNHEDDERVNQQIHFLKNLALIGGALGFLAESRRDRR